MGRRTDIRIIVIGILAVLAVVLAVLREHEGARGDSESRHPDGGANVREHAYAVVDTLLKQEGAVSIRRVRSAASAESAGRRELRVGIAPGFETLRLMKALQDSLFALGVRVVATENLREKTSSLHLVMGSGVIESVIMFRERNRKGVVPSQNKIPKARATARKARR